MKAVFDPARIERELQILERAGSPAETRTSLFNLVVISGRDDAGEIEEKLLGYLLGKRAARVIHITLDTPGSTEVSVSARCVPDREDKGVCFQEILIADGTDKAGTAPGSWSAFLIRDIPVLVLWRSDFKHRDALRFAREQADKFIIDGGNLVRRHAEDFDEYLMETKIDLLGQGVPTADLAWERFRPLRAFTARAFNSPGPMSALPDIREIRLSGADEVSLRLHALWIASRLGWMRAGANFSTPEGGSVTLEIRTSENEGIRSLFRFGNGREMDIKIAPDGVAAALYDGVEIISKAIALPTDGELLLAQVDMPGFDGLYAEALGLV